MESSGRNARRIDRNTAHHHSLSPTNKEFDTIVPMKKTFEAVYENGVFRPLTRPEGIAERRQVTLTVTAEEKTCSLAECAGRIAQDDAEEMRAIVEREFERVDPRAWQ